MYLSKSEAALVLDLTYAQVVCLIHSGDLKVELNVLGKERISQQMVLDLKAKNNIDRSKYLDAGELAAKLGGSLSAAYSYKSRIEHITFRGTLLFKLSAVEQYIAESQGKEEQVRDCFDIKEVAELLGVNRVTVYKWCNTGKLAFITGKNNQKFVHPDEVERAQKELCKRRDTEENNNTDSTV